MFKIRMSSLLLVTCAVLAGVANANDRVSIHYDRPVPGGPTYGELIEQFFAANVFPKEASYKGFGVRRDTCIVEMVETNGRGGYWFRVRARYKPVVGGFVTVGAETARVHYDNGAVRADLGGIKGAIDTRSIGRWVAERLPKNSNRIPPAATPGPAVNPRVGSIFRTQGSQFVFQANGIVVENRFNGPSSQFRIQGSGAGFVDLYDANRQMVVRLTSNRGLWRPANGGQFSPWQGSDGTWTVR